MLHPGGPPGRHWAFREAWQLSLLYSRAQPLPKALHLEEMLLPQSLNPSPAAMLTQEAGDSLFLRIGIPSSSRRGCSPQLSAWASWEVSTALSRPRLVPPPRAWTIQCQEDMGQSCQLRSKHTPWLKTDGLVATGAQNPHLATADVSQLTSFFWASVFLSSRMGIICSQPSEIFFLSRQGLELLILLLRLLSARIRGLHHQTWFLKI